MNHAIVVGAAPHAAAVLAASGVAQVGIVDPQAAVVAARLGLLHPDGFFDPYPVAIDAQNALAIVTGADAVLDLTGDPLLVNDACAQGGVTLTAAVGDTILRVDPRETACWRCAGGSAGAAPDAAVAALAAAVALAPDAAGSLLDVDRATMEVRRRQVGRDPGCHACGTPQSA